MLDPTIYKDWQIAEEAEENLPSVEYFREKIKPVQTWKKREGFFMLV